MEIFGFDGPGLSSQDWFALVHAADRDLYRGAIRDCFKGDSLKVNCEYRILVQDGEDRWVEDHGLPVRNAAGRAIRLVGAVSDVTARKEAEQRCDEALQRETATAEVLQVINSSPGDLAPVFDAMLEKAMRLCEAAFGGLAIFDGDTYRVVATHNIPEPLAAVFQGTLPIRPETSFGRIARGETPVHIADVSADEIYRTGSPVRRALVDLAGARSALWVALRKENAVLGTFVVWRQEVRPFSDKQVRCSEFRRAGVIA
jgi:PAS domain S-box-containing protein